MLPESNDSHDYKADRIRLEKTLDERTSGVYDCPDCGRHYEDGIMECGFEDCEGTLRQARPDVLNKNVLVTQDGRDFYFALDVGRDVPAPVRLIYPSPVDDWDMGGARLARAWFYIEFARRFPGVVPVFGEVEDAA